MEWLRRRQEVLMSTLTHRILFVAVGLLLAAAPLIAEARPGGAHGGVAVGVGHHHFHHGGVRWGVGVGVGFGFWPYAYPYGTPYYGYGYPYGWGPGYAVVQQPV